MRKKILNSLSIISVILGIFLLFFTACSTTEPVNQGESASVPVWVSVNQTEVTQVTVNLTALSDDAKMWFGTSQDSALSYQTTDSNARALYGWVDKTADNPNNVPLFIWGDESLNGADLALFNGVTEPNIVVMDDDLDSFVGLGFMSDDLAHIHSNRDITLMPNSDVNDYFTFSVLGDIPTIFGTGSYTRFGDAGVTNHSLASEDDLLVTGQFEVNGNIFMDGLARHYGANVFEAGSYISLRDNIPIYYGSNNDIWSSYQTADANAFSMLIALPEVAENANNVPVLVIGNRNSAGIDFGFFDGITQPNIAVIDADRDSYAMLGFNTDDQARIKTNKETFDLLLNDTDDYFRFRGLGNIPTVYAIGSYFRFGDAGIADSMSSNEDNAHFSGETEFDGTMFIDGILKSGTINIETTSAFGGLDIKNSSTGTAGVGIFTHHDSVSPSAGDTVFNIIAYGEDSASNKDAMMRFGVVTENITSGNEKAKLEITLMNDGTENLVAQFTSNGTLNVDTGYGTFDAYDDAELLRQGIKYNDLQVLIDAGVVVENIEYETIITGWTEITKPVGKERILEPEKTIVKYKQGENGLEAYNKIIPAVIEYYTVNEVVDIQVITEETPIGIGTMFNVQAMLRLLAGANTQGDDKIIELQHDITTLEEINLSLAMQLIEINNRLNKLEVK